jgi:hypothetical protein
MGIAECTSVQMLSNCLNLTTVTYCPATALGLLRAQEARALQVPEIVFTRYRTGLKKQKGRGEHQCEHKKPQASMWDRLLPVLVPSL